MTDNTLYDSVTASNIPADAKEVAGYVDGRFVWSPSDWARFTDAYLELKITAIPGSSQSLSADVCDCENGDYTPAQAAQWAKARMAAGHRPIIYCSVSAKNSIVWQLSTIGISEGQVDWWEAHYTNTPHLEPGSEATQYADPGPYDLSETVPGWTADETPAPPTPLAPAVRGKDSDMPLIIKHPTGAAVLIIGEEPIGIPDGDDLVSLQNAGVGVAPLTADFYNAVNAALAHQHTA